MKAQPLIVYLPDRRDVQVSSRWTRGNNKIGPGVYTYSRVSGKPESGHDGGDWPSTHNEGTCPGATIECEDICYATRITGEVRDRVYTANAGSDVPPIPADAKNVRAHVSGDFDTPEYILSWVERLKERPDVIFWAYTRSWRCESLLEFLEVLRALPNVQLWASMDASSLDLPPTGWRRAWIYREVPNGPWPVETRLKYKDARKTLQWTHDTQLSLVCPEELGTMPNCETCGYCLRPAPNLTLVDITFLEH